jgi:hypothetical protein
MANTRLVSMNRTTTTLVILVMNPDVPELPKSVWLAPLPKAAPISDPRPVWSRTMSTSATAESICTIVIPVNIFTYLNETAFIILIKLSDFKDAPPMRAPSMFFLAMSWPILSGVTLPPYRILMPSE